MEESEMIQYATSACFGDRIHFRVPVSNGFRVGVSNNFVLYNGEKLFHDMTCWNCGNNFQCEMVGYEYPEYKGSDDMIIAVNTVSKKCPVCGKLVYVYDEFNMAILKKHFMQAVIKIASCIEL